MNNFSESNSFNETREKGVKNRNGITFTRNPWSYGENDFQWNKELVTRHLNSIWNSTRSVTLFVAAWTVENISDNRTRSLCEMLKNRTKKHGECIIYRKHGIIAVTNMWHAGNGRVEINFTSNIFCLTIFLDPRTTFSYNTIQPGRTTNTDVKRLCPASYD